VTKFTTEIANILMNQETLHVEIRNEDSADYFPLISRVLFILNSFSKAIQSTKLII